jgi:nitrogen-specific signal transduction histidine kinase/CheY-like chemotaxis protein
VPDQGLIHAVGRDVTDEKEQALAPARAEDQLRQAQKMEAVGHLTGGVAHDFNNPLQVVVGNLEILQRNLKADSARLKRAVENDMTGARRAAVLTQRLLAFSRRQPLAPRALDPNQLVRGMSDLLSRTLGETVRIETSLADDVYRVEVDPNQLENAILNLAVNARDAMLSGGSLTIETADAQLDCAYAETNADVAPGPYAVIFISDTGSGMDRETLTRVFEPFFTTKEVGKGTGLGLSMVYGFVKQSGGHVNIYSEVDQGTTVRIYLPKLMGQTSEEIAADDLQEPPPGSRSETLLVVEDDDDVRVYSVEILRELGYRVVEAHDSASALRLLERQDGRVDLLFSDIVLPGGVNGEQLAERARHPAQTEGAVHHRLCPQRDHARRPAGGWRRTDHQAVHLCRPGGAHQGHPGPVAEAGNARSVETERRPLSVCVRQRFEVAFGRGAEIDHASIVLHPSLSQQRFGLGGKAAYALVVVGLGHEFLSLVQAVLGQARMLTQQPVAKGRQVPFVLPARVRHHLVAVVEYAQDQMAGVPLRGAKPVINGQAMSADEMRDDGAAVADRLPIVNDVGQLPAVRPRRRRCADG